MSLYEFGPFQLDAERLLLLDRHEPMPLGPRVVETLLALVEHPGEVVGKAALLARIWPEGFVDEANLAQNIYVLRKTLRVHWGTAAIETIPRRGYRFTAAVARRDDVRRSEPLPAAKPRRDRRWAIAAALVGLLLAGSAAAMGIPHGSVGSNLSAEGTRMYAIGRYYWNLRTREGIGKSLAYFARVVDSDPRNGHGYAGLALANAMMADYRYGSAPRQVYILRARAFAQKALVLDPGSGEAYAVLGMLSTEKMEGNISKLGVAIKYLRRAIALDPTSGPAHQWYGAALLQQGSVGQAYAELDRAAQLDPLSVATTSWLGTAAYLDRRYSDAVAYARETLDLSPQRSDAYETLGLAYEALGDRARAAEAFKQLAKICASCRGQAAVLLAPVYAGLKNIPAARAEIAVARTHPRDVAPEDLAVAFAAVGDRGTALSLLRRSRGQYVATEIAHDPRFDALRSAANTLLAQKPA